MPLARPSVRIYSVKNTQQRRERRVPARQLSPFPFPLNYYLDCGRLGLTGAACNSEGLALDRAEFDHEKHESSEILPVR